MARADVDALKSDLVLPLIGAPMFLTSGVDLVVAQCCAGIIGTFPALNARPAQVLDEWLTRIETRLADHEAQTGRKPAPYGVNLIVNDYNERLEEDLATIVRHRVPLVITSLSAPDKVVEAVHGYGGIVFHDVIKARHAKRAVKSGVDGLILVCAGAGGACRNAQPVCTGRGGSRLLRWPADPVGRDRQRSCRVGGAGSGLRFRLFRHGFHSHL